MLFSWLHTLITKKNGLDQLAQYMFNGQMSFLNVLSIPARHSDRYIRQGGEAAAVSCECDRTYISFSCCPNRLDNVHRIPARADAYENISGISERLNLPLKDS